MARERETSELRPTPFLLLSFDVCLFPPKSSSSSLLVPVRHHQRCHFPSFILHFSDRQQRNQDMVGIFFCFKIFFFLLLSRASLTFCFSPFLRVRLSYFFAVCDVAILQVRNLEIFSIVLMLLCKSIFPLEAAPFPILSFIFSDRRQQYQIYGWEFFASLQNLFFLLFLELL